MRVKKLRHDCFEKWRLYLCGDLKNFSKTAVETKERESVMVPTQIIIYIEILGSQAVRERLNK